MPRARLPCSEGGTAPGSPPGIRTRRRPPRSTTTRELLVVRPPETHLPGRYCRKGRTRAGRRAPARPLASLHSDVPFRPQLAAHAPRRLLRRRCCSARARRRFRLRWFRSRKKSDEQAPIEAAAPVEAPEPVTARPAAKAGQPSTSTTRPRRRRGSRGGRGRSKRPTATTTQAKTEGKAKKEPAKAARPESKPQRRERERPP